MGKTRCGRNGPLLFYMPYECPNLANHKNRKLGKFNSIFDFYFDKCYKNWGMDVRSSLLLY